jgi:sorbitol-specific phosphotransferase system component IIC
MAESDFQNEPPPEKPVREVRLPEDEDDDDLRDRVRVRRKDPLETLVPYHNPKGLIAYYLGVFALIPCAGAFLGPAALILGVLGLRYSKVHPEAAGGGHAIAGIVLGILTTLVNWGVIIFALIAWAFAARR